MKRPRILDVQSDLSIPWYRQIQKTVLFPDDPEPQIFYSIKPQDYVTVLAQTIKRDVIILSQYRPAVDDYTLEFPSGHVEEGESPLQAAERELREETNCISEELIFLGEVIPDTGRLENRLFAFYASNIETEGFPHSDENEGITVELVSPDKLYELINIGAFCHALDLSVLTLAITKKHLKF